MKKESDKHFRYYKKVVTSISDKIFNKMIKDGSENLILMEDLQSFSSSVVNEFSKVFLELLELEDVYDDVSNEFIQKTKNVFRDRLLKLAGEHDFIPNEKLVNFCCRETIALIHYSKQIED